MNQLSEAKRGKGIDELIAQLSPQGPEEVKAVPAYQSTMGKVLAAHLYWQEFFKDLHHYGTLDFEDNYFDEIFDLPSLYTFYGIASSGLEFDARFSLKELLLTPEDIEDYIRRRPKMPEEDPEKDHFTGGFLTGLIRQSFKQGHNDFTIQLEEPLLAEFSGLGGVENNYLRIAIEGEFGIGRAQYCQVQYKGNVFYLPDARNAVFVVDSNEVERFVNIRDKGHEVRDVIVKSRNLDFLHNILEMYRNPEMILFDGQMGYGASCSHFKLMWLADTGEKEVCTLNSRDRATYWTVNPQLFPEAREAEQCFALPLVQTVIQGFLSSQPERVEGVRTALKVIAYETRNPFAVVNAAECLQSGKSHRLPGTIASIAYWTKSARCVQVVLPVLRRLEGNDYTDKVQEYLRHLARHTADAETVQAVARCLERQVTTEAFPRIIADFYERKTAQEVKELADNLIKAGVRRK